MYGRRMAKIVRVWWMRYVRRILENNMLSTCDSSAALSKLGVGVVNGTISIVLYPTLVT
jgi:hypothetical protein